MDKLEEYKAILQKRLSAKRYTHTVNVAQSAVKLAQMYDVDVDKAYLAGLLHDYARNLSPNELLDIAQANDLLTDHAEIVKPDLLHGAVGAFLLKKEGLLTDGEVLNAICYHTTGHPQMSRLAKVIYVADYIEPGRKFSGVEELRAAAYEDLDYGVLAGLNHTLQYLIQSDAFIHPLSIAARNRMLEEVNIKNCN